MLNSCPHILHHTAGTLLVDRHGPDAYARDMVPLVEAQIEVLRSQLADLSAMSRPSGTNGRKIRF